MTKTKTYLECSKEWRSLDHYLFLIDHCGQRGAITAEFASCNAYGDYVSIEKADYFVVGFRPIVGGCLTKQTKILVLPHEIVTLKRDTRYGA